MIAPELDRPSCAPAPFENADWCLAPDGLEHHATGYFIPAEALAARRGDGLWEWPLHLAEKSWCVPRTFREAFLAALDRFGIEPDAVLTRSFVVGFGSRAPTTGRSRESFVALGDVIRPRSVARKRPVSNGERTVGRPNHPTRAAKPKGARA